MANPDGPLPVSVTFTKALDNSDLLITVSGTGFESTSNVEGGLAEEVDRPGHMGGISCPITHLFFNNNNVHLTLPTTQSVVSGPAGSYKVTISSCTPFPIDSNGDDVYEISALEFVPAG